VTEPRGEGSPSIAGRESEQVLRAKYLDYCSAQVAEIFLRLSPDEIFVLAREGAGEGEAGPDRSYDAMVQLATTRIYHKLDLPAFEEWVEAYQANPDRFDDQLMGLWESESRVGTDR
jgi:hypothetical protein